MSTRDRHFGITWLALGSNQSGPWGDPTTTLRRAIDALDDFGLHVVVRSEIVQTAPLVGGGRQPHYANCVVGVRCAMAPAALLRFLKALERQAGRRVNFRWGPRPLDIDILVSGIDRYGWPHSRRGGVTLPHPEMHKRGFVLYPLLTIAPHWHHPALRQPARRLYERLGAAQKYDFRRATIRPLR